MTAKTAKKTTQSQYWQRRCAATRKQMREQALNYLGAKLEQRMLEQSDENLRFLECQIRMVTARRILRERIEKYHHLWGSYQSDRLLCNTSARFTQSRYIFSLTSPIEEIITKILSRSEKNTHKPLE